MAESDLVAGLRLVSGWTVLVLGLDFMASYGALPSFALKLAMSCYVIILASRHQIRLPV